METQLPTGGKTNLGPLARRVAFASGVVVLASTVWDGAPILFAQGGPAPQLFVESQSARLAPSTALGIVRSRSIVMNLDLIGGRHGVLDPALRINLNLFLETQYVAVLQRYEKTRAGHAWIGKLEEIPFADVILVSVNGTVRGSVRMPDRTFTINYADGVGVVSETEERLLPDDEVDRPPESNRTPGLDVPRSLLDDPSPIDVAVVYSNNALAAAHSEGALNAEIDLAVASTNQAFANSGVITRLRHVYSGPIDYQDSGDLQTDVRRITSPTDRFMDDVHPMRDTYGADLIVLIVQEGALCGRAWRLGLRDRGYYGFSVTRRRCLGGLTFAHEIGHNLGAKHDWYVSSDDGAYGFSHGHVDLSRRFRTVMAHHDLCTDTSRFCTRIMFFSTPGVLYAGRPTGVAEGTDRSCTEGNTGNPPCDADNSRTFKGMANLVANFKPSKFVGASLDFPPRNETFNFRNELEDKYRVGLRRGTADSFADIEGSVVWMQEYLLYRVNGCGHASAANKVRIRIAGTGLPAVCGEAGLGEIVFPPRDQSLLFRQELETIYRDELHRSTNQTYVDLEGEVVWVQEYLRYRLNACSHEQSRDRVMQKIDGGGIVPVCG